MEDNSKIYEHLINKKTPAVTMVAAWIKAETGVGPSIASGNQPWKKIWEDLVMAPKNKNKQTRSTTLKRKPKKIITFSEWKLNCENKTKKSTDKHKLKRRTIAAKIKKSPIRFISIAFIAALVAWTLDFQKLINKKEHKPTPSHPKNSITKLEDKTKTIIKKVNKEIKDINLLL